MAELKLHWENVGPKAGALLIALLAGVSACAAASVLGDLPRKKLAMVVLGLGIFVVAFVLRQPKRVLLFFWVFSLTYNRSYFPFDNIWDNGSQGFYWIPADVFFLALLAWQAYEAIIAKRRTPTTRTRAWPWILPFATVCLLSVFVAARPDWALAEIARMAKFALVLWYLGREMGREEWWTCVAALGFGVVLQSTYNVLLLGGGRSGIGALLGGGDQIEATLRLLDTDGSTRYREAGTMGHPNILAPYLLLLVPMFLALSMYFRERRYRLACGFVGIAGLYGIAVTLSRMAWVLAAIELFVLAMALTVMHVLRAKQTLGIFSVVGLAVILALLPFSKQIEDRITGDFKASVDFRADYDRIALDIFFHHPLLGVGINNFSLALRDYDPEVDSFVERSEIVRKGIGIRVIAAVHNLYLMLLAETGILGVASFLMFVIVVLRWGRRAVRSAAPPEQIASLGLVIGVVGVLGHQVTEFSLWSDPLLFTFALVIVMFVTAPGALDSSAAGPNRVYSSDQLLWQKPR